MGWNRSQFVDADLMASSLSGYFVQQGLNSWVHHRYNVVIVYLAHGVVADSFYAYDPVISPDQHWIVGRAYYPPRSQVTFSEEYLLYDLTKSREANQVAAASPQAVWQELSSTPP